jgi:3'-phosphoadenosine 5'-phosphosulfate sulfotransferase (PAPS reductase)/FAD synthetase
MIDKSTDIEDTASPDITYSEGYSQPLLISFSGGRTSAFMARLLLELPKYKNSQKLVVFANTGRENEATLKFVNECDKRWNLNVVWLEADVIEGKGNGTMPKIVNYETASRNGQPFEDVIRKYGLPSKLYRHCTRELKQVPIHKYAKQILGSDYLTAIGIRADEKHRLGKNPNYIYPLAELGFTEQIIRNWWDAQDFDLGLKDYQGNCDLCFLKSKRKKLTILNENPKVADWWQNMEQMFGSEYQPKFDMINKLSILELVEFAQKPFRKAIDKHELSKQQQSLFEPEMDVEFDCFCKMT